MTDGQISELAGDRNNDLVNLHSSKKKRSEEAETSTVGNWGLWKLVDLSRNLPFFGFASRGEEPRFSAPWTWKTGLILTHFK